jgi:hypothetical protein
VRLFLAVENCQRALADVQTAVELINVNSENDFLQAIAASLDSCADLILARWYKKEVVHPKISSKQVIAYHADEAYAWFTAEMKSNFFNPFWCHGVNHLYAKYISWDNVDSFYAQRIAERHFRIATAYERSVYKSWCGIAFVNLRMASLLTVHKVGVGTFEGFKFCAGIGEEPPLPSNFSLMEVVRAQRQFKRGFPIGQSDAVLTFAMNAIIAELHCVQLRPENTLAHLGSVFILLFGVLNPANLFPALIKQICSISSSRMVVMVPQLAAYLENQNREAVEIIGTLRRQISRDQFQELD